MFAPLAGTWSHGKFAGKLVAKSAVAFINPDDEATIHFVDLPVREEQDIIVFSGTLEYEPNRTAVRYFSGEIWPALQRKWPNLKWRLVGRDPEAVRKYVRGVPEIECTGRVDDAIPHLAAAKVGGIHANNT